MRYRRLTLTLTDGGKVAITLQRREVVQRPAANVNVELVELTGINAAGDLLVTQVTLLRVGRAGAPFYQPARRSLKTGKGLTIEMQEAGWKQLTIDEARVHVRTPTPVAVTIGATTGHCRVSLTGSGRVRDCRGRMPMSSGTRWPERCGRAH